MNKVVTTNALSCFNKDSVVLDYGIIAGDLVEVQLQMKYYSYSQVGINFVIHEIRQIKVAKDMPAQFMIPETFQLDKLSGANMSTPYKVKKFV